MTEEKEGKGRINKNNKKSIKKERDQEIKKNKFEDKRMYGKRQ